MNLNFILSLILCFSICFSIDAQHKIEYFISGNGNLYIPYNAEKGMYPILGYDKETKPKILIGGFGIGFSALKTMTPKSSFKLQANISRSLYWESIVFTNNVASITGASSTSSTDYTLGLSGTVHFNLSSTFSIGTGLGVQTMLVSVLYLREDVLYDDGGYIGRNNYYKPLMPTVPLEFTVKLKKVFINLRYEHGLLNRLKKDLAEYKTDKYGLLFFEFGIKVK